jgi:iduronate 2-sulfatase
MLKKNTFTILIIIISSACLHAQNVNRALSKPNVLFIMVDDLRPQLGCYGQEIVSPNINRLAKKGQLFTRAYVNYPVCGPSRASVLSGLYASRARFDSWNCSQDKDVPGVISLPMLFRNNNYKTISIGKVYNNFEDGKGSWDEIWRPSVSTTQWDYQTKEGIKIFEKLNSADEENTATRNNKNLPKRGVPFERADVTDVTYEDGRIANRAIENLQQLKNSSAPFFLAVGFNKPHLPFTAPAKYWELYDEKQIKLAQNPSKPKGAPAASTPDFGELRFYYGIPEHGPLPDSLARKLIHGYYACVSYVDSQIGRVLNELEDLGLDNNTIVVLWGDHGWQLGEHGLWGKGVNYKNALQIPLIFKVPGKKSEVRQDGLVESVDIYPTICDLVGLTKPFHLQGRSFVSLLDHLEAGGKAAVYSRTNSGGETIITKTHSYTEFFDQQGTLIARMLYDLQVDPAENNNIAELVENKELVADLSEKLNSHMMERDSILLK